MTELLHPADNCPREFHASVVAAAGQAFRLDRTAFYPDGGSRPPDAGWLGWLGGEARVVDLKRDGDTVWRVLRGPASASSHFHLGFSRPPDRHIDDEPDRF